MEAQAISAADVWAVAAERLKSKSMQCYRQWFQPIVPIRINEGDQLVLGVPDKFFGEWISDNLGDLLQEVLSGIFSRNYAYAVESGHQEALASEEAAESAPQAQVRRKIVPSAVRKSLSRHTFENFVISEENRYACMAVKSAVESPGLLYNPLYVYGSSGVGKTHLLQAAQNELLSDERRLRVRYAPCSELLDNFYDLLQNKRSLSEFRSSVRDVDVLLVDDVHVLANKPQIQEEFFNLFNTLYGQQKQIILTSDKQPCEIKGLEPRLVTRFESGVTTEISVPEVEGRLMILRMMRDDALIKVKLADPILDFLAAHISSSVRRLKGAFMRLASFASMCGSGQLTVQQAEELLSAQLVQERSNRLVSIDEIQRSVAEQFEIKVADLLSSKRPQHIAEPRLVAMYLCRQLTSHSLPEIGAAFGKTHGTVLNAMKKVPELCKRDEVLRRNVRQLEQKLRHS